MALRFAFILFISGFSSAFADEVYRFDQPADHTILESMGKVQNGLRVLWWNIHHGQASTQTPKLDFTDNLNQLIHSPAAPDIMSFAEYSDDDIRKFSKTLLPAINQLYPFKKFISYKDTPLNGVVTYSKFPLIEKSLNPLDFVPFRKMSTEEKSQFRKEWCGETDTCTRYLQILSVKKGEKIFTLVPIHLYDCWRKFQALHGKLITGAEILKGSHNPLFYQIRRFRELLESKLALEMKLPGVLLYGDFNMPDHVYRIPTHGFSVISKNMNSTLSPFSQERASFPSLDSDEYHHVPSLQIDHALVSPGTEFDLSSIISLKGSDHYPLYIVLRD